MANRIGHIGIGISVMIEESLPVIYVLLGALRNPYHSFDRFHRISARRRLTGKHDCARSVINRVGDIRCFRPRGPRIFNHGFQHLRCCNDLFSNLIHFLNYHLLYHRHFFIRNFNPHIASRNHNAVGHFDNLIDVFHTLHVFNFGNNLNALAAVFIEQPSELQDILFALYKGCRYKIHILLYPKKNVFSVFIA